MGMAVKMEMPQYRSHKLVRAFKIGKVLVTDLGDETEAVLTPEANDPFNGRVEVSDEYLEKHIPKSGGYYVVYEDGYESFSPAEPFESGYDLDQGDDAVQGDSPSTDD